MVYFLPIDNVEQGVFVKDEVHSLTIMHTYITKTAIPY